MSFQNAFSFHFMERESHNFIIFKFSFHLIFKFSFHFWVFQWMKKNWFSQFLTFCVLPLFNSKMYFNVRRFKFSKCSFHFRYFNRRRKHKYIFQVFEISSSIFQYFNGRRQIYIFSNFSTFCLLPLVSVF